MFKGVCLVFFLTLGIQVLASENTDKEVDAQSINNCLTCTASCCMATSICCLYSLIYFTEDQKIVSKNQNPLSDVATILKNQKID